MASKEEITENTDSDVVKEGNDQDKEEDSIGKSANIEDKKSQMKKTLSFTRQRLSSKSLFSNLFNCKDVSISQNYSN